MILVDYSSIIHRMIFTSVKSSGAEKIDGIYQTKDFISYTKYLILNELFSIHLEFNRRFGDMVICLDKSGKDGYWRKDVYKGYKASRKVGRDKSELNYDEIFAELDGLIEQLKENVPWKVIEVPRTEADDIMLVLPKEYSKYEQILIHSPDKDMLQAQTDTDQVFQYSSLTKKWLQPENKHTNMDHWLLEHVCLGDGADDVPKVVDATEFSKNFIEHLKNNNIDEDFYSVYNFKYGVKDEDGTIIKKLSKQDKLELQNNYTTYKLNRKGESTGVLDIFDNPRFGPSTLKKAIDKHGNLDKWLDSHPLYREHYDRNYILVMAEGIPSNIWNEIIIAYKEAKTDYNQKEFEKYLKENNLTKLIMDLPSIFKHTGELTAEDFGW